MNCSIFHIKVHVLLIHFAIYSKANTITRTYILKTGKMILNDEINVQKSIHVVTNTLMECVRMCSQPDCKAVNYNEAERACETMGFDEYYKMSRTVGKDEKWAHAVKNECPGESFKGLYPGSCYFVSNTNIMNWTAARENCQAMGSDLAVLDSMDELNTLRRVFPNGTRSYWLGATDAVKEGSWRWIGINTTISDDFPAWTNGSRQATDTNEKNCLVAWPYIANEFHVKAEDCSFEQGFLCESPVY
ncbi:unnamed protein product [Owenia fusiformis]|uniref:Uncharacterized protein n=1 Tax=Owenia fusiformis TaxID=6347 RepID=A0A8J1UTW8_OWEFU|nr:unnamed protein product [Owenia fusiformis]